MTLKPKTVPQGANNRWMVAGALMLMRSPILVAACVALATLIASPATMLVMPVGIFARLGTAFPLLLLGSLMSLFTIYVGAFATLNLGANAGLRAIDLLGCAARPSVRAIASILVAILLTLVAASALVGDPAGLVFTGMWLGFLGLPRLKEALFINAMLRMGADVTQSRWLSAAGYNANRAVASESGWDVAVYSLLSGLCVSIAIAAPLAGVCAITVLRFHVGCITASAWLEIFEEPGDKRRQSESARRACR